MKNNANYILTFFLNVLTLCGLNAQGCSDAGFCTMGAMRPGQPYSKNINITLKSVELSQYLGVTRFGDKVYATTLDFNVGITGKDAVQFKLPYMAASGPLGQAKGIGDISISYTRTLIRTIKHQLNLTGGAKIPLGNSGKTFDGKPLPMYYQQNLGTYDLVIGLSYMTNKWLFATGIQYPLTANKNQFFWKPWIAEGANPDMIKQYPSSINLYRGKDVMFRAERSLRMSNWGVSLGLLGIYRLNKDIRTNPKTKEREKVEDSDGLALTALLGLKYSFNVNSGIKLIFGQRLVKRHFNPDGLSREQVIELGYVYKF
jgi:hypothetical protein